MDAGLLIDDDPDPTIDKKEYHGVRDNSNGFAVNLDPNCYAWYHF